MNSYIVFCCVHCQDETKVLKLYSNAKDVYVHWNDLHTNKQAPLPFQFDVDKLTACFYCNIISSYQGLRTHFRENHPNRTFACVSVAIRKQCGICDLLIDAPVDEHFAKLHDDMLQMDIFSPFRLTGALFDELLAINIQSKVKCAYPDCKEVFDSINAFQKHKTDTGNDKEQHLFCQQFRDFSIQTFVDCCKMFLHPTEYLKHLNDHNMRSDCGACEFGSDVISIIAHHEHSVHGIVNAFEQRYLDHLKVYNGNYWRTKVFFGNGLVLHKYNLLEEM